MAVETSAYDVLKHDGAFELRRYRGYLTANVHVAASSHGGATSAGFNPLADYIFGNNHASDRIAMTAPVSAGRVCCQKIAMTAPVTAAHSDDDYVVSFTMPSGYSMADLPQPNNPAVVLESVEPHVAAVVTFSGYLAEKSSATAESELRAWIAEQDLTPVGEPVVAQYDAPWRPGPERRNEVLIEVEGAEADPQA